MKLYKFRHSFDVIVAAADPVLARDKALHALEAELRGVAPFGVITRLVGPFDPDSDPLPVGWSIKDQPIGAREALDEWMTGQTDEPEAAPSSAAWDCAA